MSIAKSANKWAITIGTIGLLLMFAPFIGSQVHNWRLQTNTDTFTGTATAVNVTSVNVTLSQSLLRGRDGIPGEVLTITSTINEAPIASYYDGLGSKSLLITNLTSNTVRDLTIRYHGQAGGDANKYMTFMGPFLTFLVIGMIIFAIWWSHRKAK